MAFNQLFSSFDLKLWAGADLSFTYNNCTTDICHFIWRCHKQSDINIVLTKITFDNQMQKNLKWFSPYRTHGSSLVAFWTKTKSVCKWVSGSNHLLSSLTTENRA
jgi:opacity protein-like surface antigen